MKHESRQAGVQGEIEISPQMIEAGVTCLLELQRAEVGQSYLVEAVFRAMREHEPLLLRT